jgi:CheY-like chemotaxis protein
MFSAILHVEDDLALRGLVDLAFRGFGFRGTMITADNLAQAIERLDNAEHSALKLDLIISDMNLPDGSGLEVVRHVRASSAWRHTPVLILSGDVNPRLVGRAYALGANAYLDKSPRGRTLADVIRSLYEHWGKDVALPHVKGPERMLRIITVALTVRTRHARLYHSMADKFGDTRAESAFWLSRALAESNLINMLGFLRSQLEDGDFSEDLTQRLEHNQAATVRALTAAEGALARESITREEAYREIVILVSAMSPEVLAETYSQLFPVVPVAARVLRDVFVSMSEDVAAWLELHTSDPAVREQARALHAKSEVLLKQVANVGH